MIKLTFDNSIRVDSFDNPARHSDPKMQTRVIAATKLREFYERNPEVIEITCNGGEKLKQREREEKFKKTRGAIWLLGIEGFSELNISTQLPSDLSEKIMKIIHPRSKNVSKDCAVLCEHAIAKRNIFVSADISKHLKKASQLQALGIIVKSSVETVDYLEQQYGIDFTEFAETS